MSNAACPKVRSCRTLIGRARGVRSRISYAAIIPLVAVVAGVGSILVFVWRFPLSFGEQKGGNAGGAGERRGHLTTLFLILERSLTTLGS